METENKTATAYSDNEDGVEDDTEEVLIKYYFYRGYRYNLDILDLLATYHNIKVSERVTLHRRLPMYGLSRRNPEYDVNVHKKMIYLYYYDPSDTIKS